jgi:hypothetical protein
MGPILKYERPGTELTWAWLNELLKLTRTNRINLGANSGLTMVQASGVGTFLRATPQISAQLAITNGTITARVGTTAGDGNVFFVTVDGTTLSADTVDNPVLNFSSTTGGIPTSTYVWVEQDSGGNWWITAVDCGN